MKTKKINFALIALLLVSLFIRIYKINNVSLFGDEIDVGYQAYSLLNTAHDYRGYFLPFYTESLSESRAPLLIYFTIPGIKLFGLTELGVRIAPVLFGVLSIYLFYKLVLLLSKSNKIAFYSSAVLSLSPWHFLYSRSAFEVTLLITLILAATYSFFLFIKSQKNYQLFLSIILFGLSFYTYNTANIFVPLLVIYLLVSHKFLTNRLNAKNLFLAILLTLLMVAPIIKEIRWGKAAERFSSLSILQNQGIVDEIINKRNSFSSVDQSTERYFHNKPLSITNAFLKNYFQSISPSFLFFNQGQTNLRHSINTSGLLFVIYFPLLIIGFSQINLRDNSHRLFLYWLMISPIPAALTVGGGTHPTRLFVMVIPLSFFISLGIQKITQLKYSRILTALIICFLACEIIIFSHEYFIHYPKDTAKLWNYGYKEMFQNLAQYPANRIFISNSNYNSLLPYLFYNQILPTSIKLDDHEKQNIISNLSGFSIANDIYFVNSWKHNNDIFTKINEIGQKGDVFVLFQLNEIPGDMDLSKKSIEGFKTIKTVYNPDHTILGQIIQKL